MIEQIKALYKEVDNKRKFKVQLALSLGMSVQTLDIHWFGYFWSIPEKKQEEVKASLIEWLESQRAKTAKVIAENA